MKKSSDDSPRKKGDNIIFADLPAGINAAFQKNLEAKNYFAGLSETKRGDIVSQTHSITSKQQMQQFVDKLVPGMES